VLEVDDEQALVAGYRAIYLAEYVNAEVRDWAGRRVRFHAPTFDHAFSDASNYRLSAGVHDIAVSHRRLQRIRWIKWALAAEDVGVEVVSTVRQDSRGRVRRRRTVIVLDNKYVVVLQTCEDKDFAFEFVSAFPADRAYLDKIRLGATVLERRPKK
jgi:hypothetical protein